MRPSEYCIAYTEIPISFMVFGSVGIMLVIMMVLFSFSRPLKLPDELFRLMFFSKSDEPEIYKVWALRVLFLIFCLVLVSMQFVVSDC